MEPEANFEVHEVHEKLCTFSEHVLTELEKQIRYLEIALNNKHPTLVLGPIVQQMVKSVPALASSTSYKSAPGLVTAFGKQYYKLFCNKKQQQRAKELSTLIYQFINDKLACKRIVAEGCAHLFRSFEMQLVNCYVDEYNYTRALAKLSFEAVNNILNYFIKEKETKLSVQLIIRALLSERDGTFKQLINKLSTTPPSNRTIILPNRNREAQKIKSEKLYSKVGIVDGKSYYRTKTSNTCKYGYRRLFNEETLGSNLDLEENKFIEYCYVLNHLNIEDIIQEILDNIKKKSPNEMENRIIDKINHILQKVDDIPSEDVLQKLFESVVLPQLEERLSQLDKKFNQISEKIYNIDKNSMEKNNVPWFQMKDTVFNFVGRKRKIEDIQKHFLNGDKIISITGLAGIGKSEMAKKYCELNKNHYQNIVWINSETENDLTQSFTDLAIELNITVLRNGSPRPIASIVQNVYKEIKCFPSLIIFDNATSYVSIMDYMPSKTNEEINCLITSQNFDWDGCVKIKLSHFEDTESRELVQISLKGYIDIEDEGQKMLIADLTGELGHFPLALQQAVAYIIEEIKNKTEEPIVEFVRNYTTLVRKLYDNMPFPDYYKNSYKKTVYHTMQMSLQKLEDKNEINALRTLQICSFLNPERITKNLLYMIFEKNIVKKTLRSLEKYSLVSVENNLISFHRLVLEISRQVFKSKESGSSAYQQALTLILKYNWLVFCPRNITIFPLESVHSVFVFFHSTEYIQPLCTFYSQLTVAKKCQLFLLLVFYGCLPAIKLIVESEQIIKLIGYVDQECQQLITVFKEKQNVCNEATYNKYAGPATIIACLESHVEVLRFLLDRGADMNAKHKYGCSLLHAATCNGYLDIVKFLLDRGADRNITDNNGSTILHTAGANRWLDITKYLIEEKILSFDVKNNFRDTVMHTTSCFGYTLPIKVKCMENEPRFNQDEKISYIKSITALKNVLSFKIIDSMEEQWNKVDMNCDIKFSSPDKTVTSKNDVPIAKIPEMFVDIVLSVMPKASETLTYLIEKGVDIHVRNKFGFTPLHLAAGSGLYETTFILLNKGANVHVTDNDGMTPLHLASSGGFSRIVELLLDSDANVNAKDDRGNTPLHISVFNGHVVTTETLIKRNADVNVIGGEGKAAESISVLYKIEDIYKAYKGLSILHLAVYKGYMHIINLLIENGANINVKTNSGLSVLHMAAINKQTNAIKILVNKGASLDVVDVYGRTPLHHAAMHGHAETLKALLNNHADIFTLTKNNSTVFHLVAANGHLKVTTILVDEIKQCLISNKFDRINNFLNTININNYTALHFASIFGYSDIIKLLMDIGVNLDIKGVDGRSALHLAAIQGHTETIKLFINKFDFNTIDKHKRTSLILASANGHHKTVELLLTVNQINLNALDIDGRSALHLAVHNSHISIVQMLLNADINLNIKDTVGRTELHMAAFQNNAKIIEDLINKQANIDAQDNDGKTALRISVEKNQIENITLLLKRGANTDIVDKKGLSVWQVAVITGNTEALQLLITSQNKVNVINQNGRSLLHIASQLAQLEILKLLFKNGADINLKTKEGDTVLHEAAINGHTNIVDFLASKQICMNVPNKDGRTPLHLAACKGKYTTVELLLSKGADINAVDEDKRTALHAASAYGHGATVKLLIDNKVDTTISDIDGRTFLHFLSRYGHTEIINLVSNNSDLDVVDKFGDSLIHFSSSNGHLQTVQFLINRGFNVNTLNNSKRSALHLAAAENHMKVVDFLIAKGADINLLDEDGRNVLHLAVHTGNSAIISLLVNKHADVNGRDHEGRYVLQFAVALGHKSIVEILIKNGAKIDVLDNFGISVFDIAVIKENIEILEFLKTASKK